MWNYINKYKCYNPNREDVRWVGTNEQVSEMLISELKAMKIYVNSSKFRKMVNAIYSRYDDELPYHNFKHVVHVALMMIWFMKHFIQRLGSDYFNTEYFGVAKFVIQMVIIALCHDTDHHGQSNVTQNIIHLKGFDNIDHIDFENEFILSTTSFNETRHIMNAVDIFNTYGTSIWKYDLCDNLLIHNCIMSTDLQFHERISKRVHSLMQYKSSLDLFIDHPVLMGMFLLKCADVGHFMCTLTIHLHWVFKLETETNMMNTVVPLEKQITTSESFINTIQTKTNTFIMKFVKKNMLKLTDLLQIDCMVFLRNIDFWNQLRSTEYERISDEYIDSYIERMSLNKPMSGHLVEEHEDVCICMIDIVNFTKWSATQCAERIFCTMSAFNQFVLEMIYRRHDVEKIEMVGDSMMVIGGLKNGCNQTVMSEMFTFVSELLNKIQTLKHIFSDDNISLRAGMHIGTIYIGIINGPRRIQVFGNAICVASRMESIASPGTLMITHTIFNSIHQTANLIDGKEIQMSVKGIGYIKCKCMFLKSNTTNILVGDDLPISTKIISAKIQSLSKSANVNVNIKEVNDLCSLKEFIFSTQFDIIVVDWKYQDSEKIDTLLHSYKVFEKKYREQSSQILVYSSTFDELSGSDMMNTLIDNRDLVDRDNILYRLEQRFEQMVKLK